MDAHVKSVMIESSRLSDQGGVPFPEIVRRLAAAGVERYHADLIRHEKTYFLANGESEVVPNEPVETVAAQEFSETAIVAALRDIQAGRTTYKEFCAASLAAGCVGYVVSIAGKRVFYYGRTGDLYVEWFPGAKPEPKAA